MSDQTHGTPLLGAIEPKTLDAIRAEAHSIADGKPASALVTGALALGAVPILLGALASTAPAQTASSAVLDVLQYALLLENLESEFYKAVLGTSSVGGFNAAFATVRSALSGTNATILPTLQLLSQHETKHVAFLQQAITAAGGTPRVYDPAATFDFTGGRGTTPLTSNPFYEATQSVAFLLAATQGFEDTGVRAYKGQAGKLLGQPQLTPALQIHSLEARHAARIRRLRRLAVAADAANTAIRFAGTVKGDGAAAAGAPSGLTLPAAVANAFAAIYAGEGNTKHTVNNGSTEVTIDAAGLRGLYSGTDVTQAFDEPLSAAAVTAIVQPFVIPDINFLGSNLA